MNLQTVVKEIREAVRDFSFDIRVSNSEADGKAYLSLCNILEDGVATANTFKNDPSTLVLRVILAYLQENPT